MHSSMIWIAKVLSCSFRAQSGECAQGLGGGGWGEKTIGEPRCGGCLCAHLKNMMTRLRIQRCLHFVVQGERQLGRRMLMWRWRQ